MFGNAGVVLKKVFTFKNVEPHEAYICYNYQKNSCQTLENSDL